MEWRDYFYYYGGKKSEMSGAKSSLWTVFDPKYAYFCEKIEKIGLKISRVWILFCIFVA